MPGPTPAREVRDVERGDVEGRGYRRGRRRRRMCAGYRAVDTSAARSVPRAREAAQIQADSLHEHADKTKRDISEWWSDLGREWQKQIDSIRREVDKLTPPKRYRSPPQASV